MRFSFPINLNIVPNVLDSEDEFFVGKQKNAPALRLMHRQYKFAEEGKRLIYSVFAGAEPSGFLHKDALLRRGLRHRFRPVQRLSQA
jgi:hypothetical protein